MKNQAPVIGASPDRSRSAVSSFNHPPSPINRWALTDEELQAVIESADARQPAALEVPGAIRRVRRIAGLSQAGLAAKLNVAPSTIARWESGDKVPSLERFREILAVAELDLAVVTSDGAAIPPMRSDGARDSGDRHYPAHRDLRVTPISFDQEWQGERAGRWTPRTPSSDQDRHHGDHLTEAQISAIRRADKAARRAERDRQAKLRRQWRDQRFPRIVNLCLCPEECFLTEQFCVPDCPCQCDSRPGEGFGEACSLRMRRLDGQACASCKAEAGIS